MTTSIVISQPMFMPWVGLFEQLALADIFVHFDDVQLPRGRSFTNRVQLKSKDGILWMTAPLKRSDKDQSINTTQLSTTEDWQKKHIKTLHHIYASCPYYNDMIGIVEDVYAKGFSTISDLNIYAFETIARYFNIERIFHRSSNHPVTGKSSDRLLALIKLFHADRYITGHGALNYLDHALFEQNGIQVWYMDYQKKEYPQKFGIFTPYVSILDLIANRGRTGAEYICSPAVHWKEFTA